MEGIEGQKKDIYYTKVYRDIPDTNFGYCL